MKSCIVAALSTLLIVTAYSTERARSVVFLASVPQQEMTGNVRVDFFSSTLQPEFLPMQNEVHEVSRKSPWLAAGLSIILPGSGEFYAENYWKAAAFLAIDIAAWGLAYHFDKKGDKQTVFFQNYADQNWSAEKYAQYSFDHYLTPEQQNLYRDRLFRAGATPWDRVNWPVLNEMERLISSTAEGKFYSHTLPLYGDQQYFELIGKYQQFYQGWNDADPSLQTYEQIATRLNSGYSNFKWYAGERGKANDFYTTATTYVTVAIVNHVLSALDAAWTAASFNKNIHASMEIKSIPTQFGMTMVPVARVEYSF